MALSQQRDDLFSTDTPPSDFDEFDLKTLLSCSPALPLLNPMTPESFDSASYSSSHPSKATQPLADFDINWQTGELSASTFFSQPMSTFQEPLSYDPAEAFPLYQQPDWLSYSSYPPLCSLDSIADAPPTTIFPAFDAPTSTGSGLVSPTPQSITETSFNFNTLPQHTVPSQSYAIPSPVLSQTRSTLSRRSKSHSHAGSISSTSRSCTPDSSIFQANEPVQSSLSTSGSSSSSSAQNLMAYGIPIHTVGSKSGTEPQTWRCAYPGCTSRAVFARGCDLRKHFNRHSKHLFCRVDGCPQSAPRDIADGKRGSISATGGFSSKKDRARHEAKHNPGIRCEWRSLDGEQCGRVFSRMDNMKDHVRRIHKKGAR